LQSIARVLLIVEPRETRLCRKKTDAMKFLIVFLLWCGLFLLSWPLALLALVAYPFVWLLLLPFRLVGIAVGAVFSLLKAILYLPARILGHRPRTA
jgi:hypothetical protein